MALDIGLGVFVLLWAVRGWFKGFLSQVVGLGSLVGAIYSGGTIRDQVRPYALQYLPSVAPDVLDRLLWWASTLVAMVVLSGLGGWGVRLVKRRSASGLPIAPQPNRADQGAGFMFGALKGAVVASFLAAGIVQFASVYLEPLGSGREAVEAQKDASRVLAWATEHKPAEQIWNSAAVQSLVAQVTRNGLWGEDHAASKSDMLPAASPSETLKADREVEDAMDSLGRELEEGLRTASRLAPMEVRSPRLDPGSPNFLDQVDRDMKRMGLKPGGR